MQRDKIDMRQHVLTYLQQKQVGVLATASKEKLPHAATVFFIVDELFHIYIVTTQDTQKHKDIKENRHVAFVVGADNAPETVQIEGIAEVLEGEESKKTVSKLVEIATNVRYYWPPIAHLAKGKLIAIKIIPSWARWLDLHPEEYGGDDKKDDVIDLPYQQIIP